MNKIIFLSLMIFALIAVPIANAQLGAPAYQKSTHLIIDELNNIEAKHVIGFSNDPVMVNLFEHMKNYEVNINRIFIFQKLVLYRTTKT